MLLAQLFVPPAVCGDRERAGLPIFCQKCGVTDSRSESGSIHAGSTGSLVESAEVLEAVIAQQFGDLR
jgi:hypothetical protein